MSLLIRERPPLRLTCNVQTPNGPSFRWGADDPRAQNVPQGLVFGTAMPGGFAQASFTLERNPRMSWCDLEELSTFTVQGVGGQVAWQGRLEDLPSTYDPASAGVNPQAVGFQAHLDDDDSASMVYIDRDLTQWQGPSTARQLALVTVGDGVDYFSSQALADQSGNPCLQMSAQGPLPAGTQDTEAWYDSGANNLLRYVRLTGIGLLNSLVGSGGWTPVLGGGPADNNLAGYSALSGAGAVVIDLAAPASGAAGPFRYAALQAVYAGGAAGSSSLTYGWQFENLSVIGNHGLTLQTGVSGLSPGIDDGFLASDIIAHAVQTWCPLLSFTAAPGGTILPSSFVIPQAVFISPTTASTIIKQAAQYEILDWAVWEGPTFWCNPRGQYARARNWRARVGPSQLQATGPQASRIFNGVVVSWTDAAGKTNVIGPAQSSSLIDPDPQNPANQIPGLKRYAPLQVSGTSTQAAAIQIGQTFLAEQKLRDTSGQATHTGHVQDDKGVYWPAWVMRAGDTVSYVDAADPSPRRVISTSYADDGKANAVQLDQPPDSLTALLERLGVSLSALSLG